MMAVQKVGTSSFRAPVTAALAAFALAASVRADPDVTLTGAYTADKELVCQSDTTVNLNGVTFTDCSLKLKGNVTFTVNLVDGTRNEFRMVENDRECIKATKKSNLVITGGGALDLCCQRRVTDKGKRSGVLVCNDLTVKGGDISVTFDRERNDTSCIFLKGDYLQEGGRVKVGLVRKNVTNEFHGVTLDAHGATFALKGGTFEADVAGTKSRAIHLKKTGRACFSGGKVRAAFEGPQGRFVNGGASVEFTGGSYLFVTNITPEMQAEYYPRDIRAVKAEESIAIAGGDFRVDLPLGKGEVFSNDPQMGGDIVIRGGTLDLVSGDDCFSANRNLVISGGRIRGISMLGDILDANGNLTISGGDVQAFATAPGTHGLDVNNRRVLTISGGVVIATDGLDAVPIGATSRQVGGTDFVQPTYYGTLSTSDYGGRELALEGRTGEGALAVKTRLPAFPAGRKFNLLVSVPGRPATPPEP